MTLHLVRQGEPLAVADADWVVYLQELRLADRGTPPLTPGPITHDQLVTLIVAARRIITW